ncbi:MAG: formylglycine-generating enzyme family protein [Jatrophihabitantaceae bacterium]
MTVRASCAVPSFVAVPAGRLPATGGQQPVASTGFRLGATPVTVGQYWQYLRAEGLREQPAPRLHGFPASTGLGLRTGSDGVIRFDEQLAELPVTQVSWHGALAYCQWLAGRLGLPCRLPSAAEWQYAASGPAGSRWAVGNEFDRSTYAPAAAGPLPVGGFGRNPFGLLDMTGNVFEWCADPLRTPAGADLGSRVIKGGAFTVRNPESFDNATVFTADELSTVPYIGFRVLAGPTGTCQPDGSVPG